MNEDPPLTFENVIIVLIDIFTRFDTRAVVLLLGLFAILGLVILAFVINKAVRNLLANWKRDRDAP